MATPIKKKKMKDPLDEGYKTLAVLNEKLPLAEGGGETSLKKSIRSGVSKKAVAKKAGRQITVNKRKARFNLCLEEDTLERLSVAYLKERKKLRDKGEKLDKSLLVERIILQWLEDNNY